MLDVAFSAYETRQQPTEALTESTGFECFALGIDKHKGMRALFCQQQCPIFSHIQTQTAIQLGEKVLLQLHHVEPVMFRRFAFGNTMSDKRPAQTLFITCCQ
jgi:hypothetical protein